MPSQIIPDSRLRVSSLRPGIDRNSFPGPDYRDVDLNIAKSFGIPQHAADW